MDHSDHDELIRLKVIVQAFMEASSTDRARLNQEIGKLQVGLHDLQEEVATAKGGWRVLVFIGTVIGGALGVVSHALWGK